jgi:hypothetical protein
MRAISLVCPGAGQIQPIWKDQCKDRPKEMEEILTRIRTLTSRAISSWKEQGGFEDEELATDTNTPLPRLETRRDTQPNSAKEAYEGKRGNTIQVLSSIPIEKLPDEILGLIFEEYINMGYDTVDLAGVSKRWDQVVLHTPSLWGRIRIENFRCYGVHEGFLVGEELIDYYENFEICYCEKDLRNAFSRSGTCPLDIVISYGRDYASFDIDFMEALQLLSKSPLAANIRFLSIYMNNGDLSAKFPDIFSHMALPSLESLEPLCIPKQWNTNLMDSISNTCNKLRILEKFGAISLFNLPNEICQGITDVILDEDISQEDFDQVIPKFPQVRRLENLPVGWPSEETTAMVFYNVQEGSLATNSGHFRRIEWPELRQLTVEEWTTSSPPHSPLPFMALPSLESLDLVSEEPYKWLSNITMPNLTSLEIEIPFLDVDSDGLKENPLSIFPTVKTFRLTSAVNDEMTIVLLRALPNVLSVSILPSEHEPFPGEFGLQLIPRLTQHDGGFLLCPKLQGLELGKAQNGVSHVEKRQLLTMVRRLIATRDTHSSDLRKVNIFWDENKLAHAYT